MRTTTALSIVTLIVLAAPAMASVEQPDPAPQSAALGWLRLLDAGSYPQSWNSAAPFFREHISLSQWRSKVEIGRVRLGDLLSRQWQSEQFVCGPLPHSGLPDGRYAIVRFASRFSWYRHEDVIENVILTEDAGGIWRVADFYLIDGAPSDPSLIAPGKPCS
jgi:hypothetical protein